MSIYYNKISLNVILSLSTFHPAIIPPCIKNAKLIFYFLTVFLLTFDAKMILVFGLVTVTY